MRIDENVRKCVAFVALRMNDGTFRFMGSAFWLGRDVPGQTQTTRMYLVTARHVIDGIRKTGIDKVWLRLNHTDGSSKWASTELSQWYVHPSDPTADVAILEAVVPPGCDHLVVPFSLCLTPEAAAANEVSLGDEVFVVGLFAHHYGEQRNIPIVRVGNLAARDEEKLNSREFGKMDAYLIEARSIGGLSGSPVFLNLGLTRIIEGQFKQANGSITFLLGLVHGHYDVDASKVDAPTEQANRVNTGIAIVVPVHTVMAVIGRYERDRGAPTASIVEESSASP